jgi:arginase
MGQGRSKKKTTANLPDDWSIQIMKKTIRIIGIPMDLGQMRRGVDMGPSAIRYAGLADRLRRLGYIIDDDGNIDVQVREHLMQTGQKEIVDTIHRTCERAYGLARKAVQDDCIPLFLGGDHSIAIGTVGGVTHDEPSALVWIDAHGDFNIPETSPNGNIHGMPVAILLGMGLPVLTALGRSGPKVNPQEVVLLGTRNLDYDEKTLLRNSGVHIYTMREIDERGIGAVIREVVDVVLKHARRIHVSLDMDALDPRDAPGVGTPAPGGFTYREAHLCMEILHDSNRITSMDIVEINPILDRFNRTSKIAVELAASLLGERII